MGSGVSQEQKGVPDMMKLILKKHSRKAESTNLNRLLLWAKDCDPTLNSTNVFDPWAWDALGDSLWDQATRGNRALEELLCPWWTACKALMTHVAPGDQKKKDACAALAAVLAPSALPLSKTQGSNHKLVGVVGGEPADSPCSPDPFDPGGELDLFPPDPHDRWAAVRKQVPQRGMQI